METWAFERVKVGKTASRLAKGASGEFAYDALRREIVSLALAPGATLEEASLIARLGLSRTPRPRGARQARGRWSGRVASQPRHAGRADGLDGGPGASRSVSISRSGPRRGGPRSGAAKAHLDLIEQHRIAFELAVRADAQGRRHDWTATGTFHAAIAAACGNTVFERFYLRLLTENLRIARLAMTFDCFVNENAYQAHIDDIVREHLHMIEAIRRRDADAAEALARSHTNLARKRVAETFSQGLPSAFDIRLDAPSNARS